jgi:hypothetical protein
MQLIYRGHTYRYKPNALKIVQPRALNWRYQIPGQTYEINAIETSRPARTPLALNWRYQYPTAW